MWKHLALPAALAFLAGSFWASPAQAAKTYVDSLTGIEISPGVVNKTTRVGVVFEGKAAGALPGKWTIEVQYTPPHPGANVVNTIVGGGWRLTVTDLRGQIVGTLFGSFTSGKASWDGNGEIAGVTAQLKVLGGTKAFQGASGTGTITGGTLSHKTLPPRVSGTLTLAF